MALVLFLSTTRIGQLTGSTDDRWKDSVDAMRWPLLNDTGRWGVLGVDLGASTEHEGRTYFFFGDVANQQGPPEHPFFSDNPNGSDFIAWTDDSKILRHGGHLAVGWNFFLPNDHQGAGSRTGQKDWRFCGKCGGLFWAPDGQAGGVCLKSGSHTYHPTSWNFYLPNDHQGATDSSGQKDWRFCSKCHSLFWAPSENAAESICPLDFAPHQPLGWNFYLPNDHQGANAGTGQSEWRFCANCQGLFWNDDAFKGVCPGAPGGGFHLNGVLKRDGTYRGKFLPFRVKTPIGLLLLNETPTGAFSYACRVYVFIWVGNERSPAHPAGSYLVSKVNPADDQEFDIEFLFSRLDNNPRGLFQVAPCVVNNTEHSLLPPSPERNGVVMFGQGGHGASTDAIHLAWMPLNEQGAPVQSGTVQYYTGNVLAPWSIDSKNAAALPFDVPRYTSVSAAWLAKVGLWIVLYSTAIDDAADFARYRGQIIARFSSDLLKWSAPIPVFDPDREGAYGKYMHWPGSGDTMDKDIPPLPPPIDPIDPTRREDKPGWAYGAFIIERFTEWNESAHVLTLSYLLSTSRPYQVHLMQTRLHIRKLFEAGTDVETTVPR